MNGLKLTVSYLLNPGLKERTEKIFEGIEAGRTKALYHWFNDTWTSIDLISKKLENQKDVQQLREVLLEQIEQFNVFSELFILTKEYVVIGSTYKSFIGKKINKEYTSALSKDEKYMYGPYVDDDTLKVGQCKSDFFDEVTLMFIKPIVIQNQKYFLCGRVPNDVMSDILQSEDSHIYKDSGDNYLFMVENNRRIPRGSAISRSRFEDNAFTLGDNLKDGIKTNGYGMVQVKKYTEFEIIFNNPKTKQLHEGVQKTIDNGSNIEAWPGYPEYRHILVGGKGVIVDPPYTNEKWGLLCEGDIDEIYQYKSINVKSIISFGIFNGILIFIASLLKGENAFINGGIDVSLWLLILINSIFTINYLLTNPIDRTVEFLKSIAEGEGDLTKRLDTKTKDDMGELARWFNKFINNQMNIVRRIFNATSISNKSVNDLNIVTGDVSNSQSDMKNAIDDIMDTMKNYTMELKEMENKFTKISEGFTNIYDTMSLARENMTTTNKKAIESRANTESVSQLMNEIVSDVNNTLEGMETLEQHSDNITNIVDVINSISDETKLLALNASIEAARAGEHGLGFAVVADEISKLASMTMKSTTEIDISIKDIQNGVDNNKNNIQYINDKIHEGNEKVALTIESFAQIQGDISEINLEFEKVSELMSKEINVINQISDSVVIAVDNFEKSAELNEKDTRKILDDLTHNVDMIKQIKDSLEYTSSNLYDMVNAFKL